MRSASPRAAWSLYEVWHRQGPRPREGTSNTVRPDPTDRRAKLIVLTNRGKQSIAAGIATIDGLEDQITATLGERGHRQLRTLLRRLLNEGQIS